MGEGDKSLEAIALFIAGLRLQLCRGRLRPSRHRSAELEQCSKLGATVKAHCLRADSASAICVNPCNVRIIGQTAGGVTLSRLRHASEVPSVTV